MTTVQKPALLCDTGLLSRVFLVNPLFLDAYQTASLDYQAVISTAVFIELQHWLLIQRGLINPVTRAEYDRHRKRSDNYLILNSDGVSQKAVEVARR